MQQNSNRNKLIEENYKFALKQSQRFSNMVFDRDDRCSIAGEALVKAVDSYEPNRGANLQTHIINCIRNSMIKESRAAKRKKRSLLHTISMDYVMHGGSFGDYTMHDILPSSVRTPLEQVVLDEECAIVRSIVSTLPVCQKEIIYARYLGDVPVYQNELGRRYKRTQDWVSRQEKKGLRACQKKYEEIFS